MVLYREIKKCARHNQEVEFQAQAPLPGEILMNRDPDEVIRACLGGGAGITSMVSWLNFCLGFHDGSTWLPDRGVRRQAAILAAEAILIREGELSVGGREIEALIIDAWAAVARQLLL